jgi:hypothetical protein
MDARSGTSTDLDLDVNEAFDRRWRISECAIILLLCTLCFAGLAGLLGSGPMSHAFVHFQSGTITDIRYERIVRNHGSSWMRLGLAAGTSGTITVHLDRRMIHSVAIENVVPTPLSENVSDRGVTYVFNVANAEEGASLNLKMSPYRFGVIETTLSAGNRPVNLVQVVLP